MPVVTRLLAGKRKDNVKVYIDDKFALTLSPNEVVANKLYKGLNLSDKKIELLKNRSNYEKYYLKSLNLISYRLRSRGEITDYLSRLSVAPHNISRIIKTLTKQGYLNDFEFALAFTNSKINLKLRGPRRIRQELLSKNVSKETIDQVFKQVFPDNDSLLNLARRALAKKQKSFNKLTHKQTRLKASQYLIRQGFDYSTINLLLGNFID